MSLKKITKALKSFLVLVVYSKSRKFYISATKGSKNKSLQIWKSCLKHSDFELITKSWKLTDDKELLSEVLLVLLLRLTALGGLVKLLDLKGLSKGW